MDPCLGPVRTLRNPDHPGHGQRSALHPRRVADEQGWARIREQYADSGGFTDHVFAATSLLGYRFIPRIRDLPSKRLHVFEPGRVPQPLIGLTGNKIREDVIVRNWPDILRVAATLASGVLPTSQLLRKFAAYPRQHELAVALREIGRVERTLFIVDWLLDAGMQRRANAGLKRGSSRPQERPPHRAPGRNPRPLQRGPALPHGRPQPSRRHGHLLEYHPSRRSGQTAETRRPDRWARASGPHLAPWVGPHLAHRRIPLAKASTAALAYDSAPCQSRPVSGWWNAPWLGYPRAVRFCSGTTGGHPPTLA